jgi:hypothetical protein
VLDRQFVVMPKYTIGVHGLSSWGLASEVDMEHVMARGFRLIMIPFT